MPEFFTLEIRDEKGHWWEHGGYYADHFVRGEDGSYFCQPLWGSPVYLRCIAHHAGYFEHIDEGGHGQIWAYRLIPRPPIADS
jgi:hypothetical protein